MQQIIGSLDQLGWIALKALLLYLTAVIGFRLSERRTLAEMSAFDFVAAVAVGAIVGRVPNADTTSYLAGAVTLITILIAHRITSKLRQHSKLATLLDHPPRILVSDGKVLSRELLKAGLTQDDLYGLLRQHGITDLSQIHLVIFEQRGKVSVINSAGLQADAELLKDVRNKATQPI